MTLQRYLIRLIWLCIGPPALLAAWLALGNVFEKLDDQDAFARNLAHNTADAVDRDLGARTAALVMLAGSPRAADPANWAQFYERARAYRDNFGGEVAFVGTDGQMRFNTRVPFGTPLPALPRPTGESVFERALKAGNTAVGDIVTGPLANRPLVSIAAAGNRGGTHPFVVLSVVDVSRYERILGSMALPSGWSVTLRDGSGAVIARHSPSGITAADVDPRSATLEKSSLSNWTVVADISRAARRAPALEALGKFAALMLGAVILAFLAARLASRRLAHSVAALANSAIAPAETSARDDIDEIATVRRRLGDEGRKREAAELGRHASDQRFRAAFEQAAVGICLVGLDGTFTQVNQRLCAILGYTSSELLGQSVQLIALPEDQEEDRLRMQRLVTGVEALRTYERLARRKDGTSIWINASTTLARRPDGSPDHFVAVIEDIHARKTAETELQASEERFRAVLDQSIAAVYVIQDGRLVYANPRTLAIFGYETGETMNPDPLAHIAPEDHERMGQGIAARLEHEPEATATFGAQRHDGSRFTVTAHARRALYDGRPAIIVVAQDVTEKEASEARVREYVTRLEQAMQGTIGVVARIGELRDPYTYGHQRRAAEVAAAIARQMGFDADRVEGMKVAGYMHDVGKLAVPAEILSKTAQLSKAETALVRTHTEQGYSMLSSVRFDWPIALVALQHHERLDGSGYPKGLRGDEIILEARIMGVADVIEAMASHRPYRPALGLDAALAEIQEGRGTRYDARVVDASIALFRESGFQIPN